MASGGVDERTQLQEQVKALREQLVQAQKMTALGELTSTTTHEFNNVLMTIINYAKLGLRHKDNATREKAFNKILAAGNRAARITNGILGLARNRTKAVEPTDLARLIDDALVLLERELNKYRITVEKRFDTVPKAMVNGNQIQQVLLNLLINARQAMPRGGRLVISLSYDERAETVDMVVRDNGQGIPPEKLRKIFDRFYSTKAGPDETGKGGTGLGLSACRDILEAHHGRIRVDSTVGRGTAFTIKLPAVRRQSEVPVTAAAVVPLGRPDAAPSPTTHS